MFVPFIKMKTDQLYIDDRRDYFCGNLVDILKFKASNLNLDKKTWKDLDIYFIGYVSDDKKHSHCGSIIFIN